MNDVVSILLVVLGIALIVYGALALLGVISGSLVAAVVAIVVGLVLLAARSGTLHL